MLTRPTWAVLIERTGLARSTVAGHLAWLRKVGLLGLVAGGTTGDHSPAILKTPGAEERNEAAVYVLTAPHTLRLVAVTSPDDVGAEHVHDGRDLDDPDDAYPTGEQAAEGCGEDVIQPPVPCSVDRTWTPTGLGFGFNSPARARTNDPRGAGLRPALTPPTPMRPVTPQDTPEPPPWPLGSTPAGRKDRLAAAVALQQALPVLGRISTAHVAALCREWHLAGWTPADIVTALGRIPDGTPRRYSHDIRHVPGWFRHRLTAWRTDPSDPASPPTRSPAARAIADATHARAAARARAEQLAAEAGCGADHTQVHAWAETVRAAHRAARQR
jgi:hypothetical protein